MAQNGPKGIPVFLAIPDMQGSYKLKARSIFKNQNPLLNNLDHTFAHHYLIQNILIKMLALLTDLYVI